jgi:hypothetical protein
MNEIYAKAVMKFGVKAQLNVALEELAELQKEICKFFRGRDNRAEIIEEMADVYIMMEQMRIIFEVQEVELIKAKTKKLIRLQKLLESEGEK